MPETVEALFPHLESGQAISGWRRSQLLEKGCFTAGE